MVYCTLYGKYSINPIDSSAMYIANYLKRGDMGSA
jgi:hypothetical protein